ncbi:MAG: hypothetical protein EZS28_023488 [Streblomastix strix]|uniref:Uncharacterized protein n=1 Tax=Streblomastix strix TaxID=222440 RepID=A0A5J4VF37_9EUKA|nr:MAG: hypothetical protein EZS28_023488 [Streblomastix strix]
MNSSCKQVIWIPNLRRSLTTLVTFRLDTHLREEIDQQRLEVRSTSRDCLYWFQVYGDEQDQTELVNNEYGRVMSITFSTAGGVGEEQNQEIIDAQIKNNGNNGYIKSNANDAKLVTLNRFIHRN